MKIGDQPAFPSEQHETNDGAWNQTYDSGMTYRMWLVGMAISSGWNDPKKTLKLIDDILKEMEDECRSKQN